MIEIQLHWKYLYISERLPRPDEIVQYEKSFRNITTIIANEDGRKASGCQAFTQCQEMLMKVIDFWFNIIAKINQSVKVSYRSRV